MSIDELLGPRLTVLRRVNGAHATAGRIRNRRCRLLDCCRSIANRRISLTVCLVVAPSAFLAELGWSQQCGMTTGPAFQINIDRNQEVGVKAGPSEIEVMFLPGSVSKLEVVVNGSPAYQTQEFGDLVADAGGFLKKTIPLTFGAGQSEGIRLRRARNRLEVRLSDGSNGCRSIARSVVAVSDDIHAVLIAPEDYDPQKNRFKRLSRASSDLSGIRDRLTFGLNVPPENIYAFSAVETVNAHDIEIKLRELHRDLRPEDTVIFYFSGHGLYEEPDPDHFRTGYYFVMSNSRQEIDSTYLNSEEVLGLLNLLKAQQRIAILDACFSGSTVATRRVDDTGPRVVISKSLYGSSAPDQSFLTPNQRASIPNIHIFSSSHANQFSYESKYLSHSLFTHFLLAVENELGRDLDDPKDGSPMTITVSDGLPVPRPSTVTTRQIVLTNELAGQIREWRSDNIITLHEAFKYAQWRVQEYLTQNEGAQRRQTPDYSAGKSDLDVPWVYLD